jgi:hypothetical protein
MVQSDSEGQLRLNVKLTLEDGDEAQLDSLTRSLRKEILELDVDSAEMASEGEAPEGAKALDMVLLGTLMVAVAPIVVTQLLEFLQAWTMRREGRSLKVRLEAPEGGAVEIQVPETTSREEVQNWIETVRAALPKA